MQLLQELSLKNGPLCVGLDTDPSYIPENIVSTYQSAPAAVLAYNKAIIDRVVADKSACCFKVQIAYYEAMGLEGMKVYAETLKYIRSQAGGGLLAISDIKRGDIGATSDAYAKAHFTGDFETDIITINPYMGFDTLQPFTKYSSPETGGKGAFVLLCTSNPGMTDIEHQKLAGSAGSGEGGLLLERVGDEIERIGNQWRDECPAYADQTCGIFGAVVGATQEADARYLRDKYADTFFLIPGYGAQGGAARIAATLLDKAGGAVNSSRGILCAWKKDEKLAGAREGGTLTMNDIADSAARASLFSKEDLLAAKASL
ncbi:MAG: orotidine-5'-phosphate decarboxylase [Treponema sp.]|nr:orotidine-5'-phosphate decarboxylase [Treponema sp.]